MNITTSGTEALALIRTYCGELRRGEAPTNARAAGRLLARFDVVQRIVWRAQRVATVSMLADGPTPLQALAADALAVFEREAAPHLLAMLVAAEPGLREQAAAFWGGEHVDNVWPV